MSPRKPRPDQAAAIHIRGRGHGATPLPGPPDVAQPTDASQGPAHFPLDALRWSDDEGWMPQSQALLCQSEPKTAIVFVHGFGGGADGTWETFPRSIRAMPEAALADAFFVDYPSTTHTISFCAAQFRRFLMDLVREPAAKVVNPSLPNDAPRRALSTRYEKIVLVGHSMGAVVARRALLDLDRNELTPTERDTVQMLFFAPAHKGARDLGKLVESGLGLDKLPFGGLVGGILRLWYRSVADLTKQSDCLRDLDSDSKARREDRRRASESGDYLRARVCHAQNDRVVYDDAFDDDFPIDPVMGRNHRSVCKPDNAYRKPLETLRKLL